MFLLLSSVVWLVVIALVVSFYRQYPEYIPTRSDLLAFFFIFVWLMPVLTLWLVILASP